MVRRWQRPVEMEELFSDIERLFEEVWGERDQKQGEERTESMAAAHGGEGKAAKAAVGEKQTTGEAAGEENEPAVTPPRSFVIPIHVVEDKADASVATTAEVDGLSEEESAVKTTQAESSSEEHRHPKNIINPPIPLTTETPATNNREDNDWEHVDAPTTATPPSAKPVEIEMETEDDGFEKITATATPPNNEDDTPISWPSLLQQLQSMGFDDVASNVAALKKHRGDLNKAVSELVNNMNV